MPVTLTYIEIDNIKVSPCPRCGCTRAVISDLYVDDTYTCERETCAKCETVRADRLVQA